MQVSAGAQRPEDEPGGLTPTHRTQSVPPHKNNLWKTKFHHRKKPRFKVMVPFLFIPPPGSTLLLSPSAVLRSCGPVWGATSGARPKLQKTALFWLAWLASSSTVCLRHRRAHVRQPGLRVHLLGTQYTGRTQAKRRKKSVFLDV